MRAALALLLALLPAGALLSGCVETTEAPAGTLSPGAALVATTAVLHAPGGIVLPSGQAMGERAIGGQYHLGAFSTEPTIGVTAEGAVFMTAMAPNPNLQGTPVLPFAGVRSGPTIMRSLDKGQTWEDVFPKLPTGDGQRLRTYDPYVYVVVETGRVYMDDIYPLSCGMLSWSDDQGATWATNPYACGNGQVNDHQSLVTAKPRVSPVLGYPKVVHRCVNNVAYVGCAASFDGGLTFRPQVPAYHLENGPGCGALHGHLRADSEGRVYIPVADCDRGPTLWVSENDGLTWLPIVVPAAQEAYGHELGLAIDETDNLYVTWNGADGRIHLAASFDRGVSWTKTHDVTAPGVTATMFNAVAAGAPGKVAFAYVGTTVEGGYEGKDQGNPGLAGSIFGQPETSDWDNATWNAYVGVIEDATAEEPVIQTVTANDPADPIARGLCGRTRCHGMNDFIDMVVDLEGRPWVAFVDVCTRECVTDPTVHHDVAIGFAGTLRAGPALRGEAPALPLLAQQARPAGPDA